MLEEMIMAHAERTGSGHAREVLARWHVVLPQIQKVVPRDYKRVLRERAALEAAALAATE